MPGDVDVRCRDGGAAGAALTEGGAVVGTGGGLGILNASRTGATVPDSPAGADESCEPRLVAANGCGAAGAGGSCEVCCAGANSAKGACEGGLGGGALGALGISANVRRGGGGGVRRTELAGGIVEGCETGAGGSGREDGGGSPSADGGGGGGSARADGGGGANEREGGGGGGVNGLADGGELIAVDRLRP